MDTTDLCSQGECDPLRAVKGFFSGILLSLMLIVVLVLLVLLITGCSPQGNPPLLQQGSPVVRADGAAASLTIIACPPSESRAQGLGELMRELMVQDELVIAQNGGSARLTLNTCPGGFSTPPLQPTSRRISQ